MRLMSLQSSSALVWPQLVTTLSSQPGLEAVMSRANWNTWVLNAPSDVGCINVHFCLLQLSVEQSWQMEVWDTEYLVFRSGAGVVWGHRLLFLSSVLPWLSFSATSMRRESSEINLHVHDTALSVAPSVWISVNVHFYCICVCVSVSVLIHLTVCVFLLKLNSLQIDSWVSVLHFVVKSFFSLPAWFQF